MATKNIAKQPKDFPFVTGRRIAAFLLYYAVVMGILGYFYIKLGETNPTEQAEYVPLIIFMNVFFVEYLLFFYIPYIIYIRKTGRFLYWSLSVRRWRGPFAPLDDEPFEYNAVPIKDFLSFIISMLCMFGSLFFILMPTIYLLFGSK